MTIPMTRRRIIGGALAASTLPVAARGQQGRDASREPTEVGIRITFNDLSMTATLYAIRRHAIYFRCSLWT